MNFYFSPSNQPDNSYVTGDTNEKEQMERITSRIVTLLKGYDCNPIMANLNLTIKKADRPKEASEKRADFYTAVHSNATGQKPPCHASGAVAFYHPDSSRAKELAQALINALDSISPVKSNRSQSVMNGMEAFNGAGYGEIRSPMEYGIPAVLLEINFHDNPVTAQWIISHTNEIADAIANTYVYFFELQPIKDTYHVCEIPAVINDPAAPLNLRTGPGPSFPLSGCFNPAGQIMITRKYDNGWCEISVVSNNIGYVNRKLLKEIDTPQLYRVQVGAFYEESNAQRMLDVLKSAGFPGFIVKDT